MRIININKQLRHFTITIYQKGRRADSGSLLCDLEVTFIDLLYPSSIMTDGPQILANACVQGNLVFSGKEGFTYSGLL